MTAPNYNTRHRAFIDVRDEMLKDLKRAKEKLLKAKRKKTNLYEILKENYNDINDNNYENAYNEVKVEQAIVHTLSQQVLLLQGRIDYCEKQTMS